MRYFSEKSLVIISCRCEKQRTEKILLLIAFLSRQNACSLQMVILIQRQPERLPAGFLPAPKEKGAEVQGAAFLAAEKAWSFCNLAFTQPIFTGDNGALSYHSAPKSNSSFISIRFTNSWSWLTRINPPSY